MKSTLIFLLCSLGILCSCETRSGGSCPNPDGIVGSSVLQKAAHHEQRRTSLQESDDVLESRDVSAVPEPEPAPEPERERSKRGEDARFLMQATFGPTRELMEELKTVSYKDWIQEQLKLPVGSHREYLRQRVNPVWDYRVEFDFHPSAPCDQGRFRSFAFAKGDRRKTIEVSETEIKVDGVVRSQLKPHPLATSWQRMIGYKGLICHVQEEIGGDVILHHDMWVCDRLHIGGYTTLPNPAVMGSGDAPELPGRVVTVKPGVVSLAETGKDCSLTDPGNTSTFIVKVAGEEYIYENRLRMLSNTPDSPSSSESACAPRNHINEETCLFAEGEEQGEVPGLLATVHELGGEDGYIGKADSTFWAQVVDGSLDGSFRSFPDLPQRFAVTWTGKLKVKEGGKYTMGLHANDGAELWLGGQRVVDCGGVHRHAKWCAKDWQAAAGSHDIEVRYFRAAADSWWFQLKWNGADSGGEWQVVPKGALSTRGRAFAGGGCAVACGSAGEVANEPALGHQLPLRTSGISFQKGNHVKRGLRNRNFDNRYAGRMGSELAKSTVWTMKVLEGKDQLRQRTAWALSQIIVVSTQGIGDDDMSEIWVNFYDIFVRHAFKNFRDILREVTFNPLMGRYLTHTGSSSYDYNKNMPNENYGREIMQLFTIGLNLLNPDGTEKKDAAGASIPTYTNENILNFARVFTGFAYQRPRGNMEFKQHSNLVDPMRIVPERHDVYPKPDLTGGYIGDGYPLCSDPLPQGIFLREGARYELSGLNNPDDVGLQLPGSSKLGRALCGADLKCSRSVVILKQGVSCTGAECSAATPDFVKVGSSFLYRFVPPPCVHFFFSVPTATAALLQEGDDTRGSGWQKGWCTKARGRVRKERLDSLGKGSSVEKRKAECLAKCRKAGNKGCVVNWSRRNTGCYSVTETQKFWPHGRSNQHACYVFETAATTPKPMPKPTTPKPTTTATTTTTTTTTTVTDPPAPAPAPPAPVPPAPAPPAGSTPPAGFGVSYMPMKWGWGVHCPEGTEIEDPDECAAAARSIGLRVVEAPFRCTKMWERCPKGCSFTSSSVMYASFEARWKHLAPKGSMICKSHMHMGDDGTMVMINGHTRFTVPDLDTPPSPGTYPLTTETVAVFSTIPSKEEALSRLKVGAYPPEGRCSFCGRPVKAYGSRGRSLDAGSVLEIDGKFFKNVEGKVKLEGGETFRNPPVFLKSTRDAHAVKQVHAEVEALLDHLFYHPNTAVFISRRLIQRFVSSNPSPTYVSAVSEAFRTGRFGRVTYSGEYGDLAATVAAVLLHPEARIFEDTGRTSTRGALREPMMKYIHLLRSMEYKDPSKEQVVFRQLHDIVGQFPYQSPSVFNYYLADYDLPEITGGEPEPEQEPEPEPEPEPESEGSLFGPEFQIFTPPYMVGYLNGMQAVIESGVDGDCQGGGKHRGDLGLGVSLPEQGRFRQVCPQGALSWSGAGSPNRTVEELNVLLTGGRLSPSAKEVVKQAYERAGEGKKIEAAQKAVIMTAEFNTLGASLPLPGARPPVGSGDGNSRASYKAVVFLFMAGGADTWNMVVPMNCDLYEEYRKIRTDLTMEPNELAKVRTAGQKCSDFGIHASFEFVKKMYDKKQAAFVTNVGNLVEPMNMASFRSGKAAKCFNLFSHSDQQNGAMTLKCQQFGTTAHGAGGRMADALAGGRLELRTESFSLAGSSVWSKGAVTRREIVDNKGGQTFNGYEEWLPSIANISAQRHGNVYAEAYSEAFLRGIETSQHLFQVLDKAETKTKYDTRSGLQRQFYQVAKLISAREGRKAERDFFFLSVGGWDMHSNLKDGLENGFGMVDKAIKGFVLELEEQKVWNNVVIMTSSEFARTLDSNGGGSDHAWGGQQLIMSGSLKGGRIFNKFPDSLLPGSARDLGRGRLIPEYPWESALVPVAHWLGVTADQHEELFPNLKNFNSSHLIPRSQLLK